MSILINCPHCAGVARFDFPPAIACPLCHHQFPDALRAQSEAAIAGEHPPRPPLLTFGMGGSALLAALLLFSFSITGIGPLSGTGTYSLNHHSISAAEYMLYAGINELVIGVLSALIAFGLYRHQWWSRPLMLVWWIYVPIAFLIVAEKEKGVGLFSLAFLWLPALVAWLYLYQNDSVVRYYDVLSYAQRDLRSGG